MAGIAIVLDLLKKSQSKHSFHSSSICSAAAAVSAAATAPFASRFLFGSFEPRVAYCNAAAGIDDDYLGAIRKMSADVLQREPLAYISTSKEYNIQPKPLFSAFEFRALAMTTVRSLLMFYLPLWKPKTAMDLIAPLKKSAMKIAREITVMTAQRLLEWLAMTYASKRMAWKLLKDVSQSALRKAQRGLPIHVYIFKVSQTTLIGHFLGTAASWAVQVGIEIYSRVFPNVKPEGEEEEPVKISVQAKDFGYKVVGITVRCGASLVFAAIGAGICACLFCPLTVALSWLICPSTVPLSWLIFPFTGALSWLICPSMGQQIGCALGDWAGPMVVSVCERLFKLIVLACPMVVSVCGRFYKLIVKSFCGN